MTKNQGQMTKGRHPHLSSFVIRHWSFLRHWWVIGRSFVIPQRRPTLTPEPDSGVLRVSEHHRRSRTDGNGRLHEAPAGDHQAVLPKPRPDHVAEAVRAGRRPVSGGREKAGQVVADGCNAHGEAGSAE